jgi:hypothetical protein
VLSNNSDNLSIFILLVLYTLQGIPMGLCGSIPLILKEKGVSYESLSLFSLVSLPFSLKLLWAPVVILVAIPSRPSRPRVYIDRWTASISKDLGVGSLG